MESNQRRYTIAQTNQVAVSKNALMSKEDIRRALIERRTIIGPHGEKFDIPKHMCLDDMLEFLANEYHLTRAEITQIMAAAQLLTTRPDYRGKINRILIDGAENPLRIEIPKKRMPISPSPVIPEAVVDEKKEIEDKGVSTDKAEKIEKHVVKNPSKDDSLILDSDVLIPLEFFRRPNSTNANLYTIPSTQLVRKENQVNQIASQPVQSKSSRQRIIDQDSSNQNKTNESQLNAQRQEKNKSANRRSRRVRLTVVAAVGLLWITGIIVDIAGLSDKATISNREVAHVESQSTSGKLFESTPETIGNFTEDLNLIPTAQKANYTVTQLNYQTFEESIDTISQGLNQKSNLSKVLNNYSYTAEKPIVVGEISSYQEFEQLLQSGDEDLYRSGPAYFANFSRQMLHGMLKDKYGAERVKATYEKTGENNQNYEFYIRYFKSGSSSERTSEGRVNMTRNDEGRLQTNEYHTLPYEVYELLAIVGEFSDFANNSSGLLFDIKGYAEKYTDGDIEKAREELKTRMTYGTEAMKTLLENRVKEDKIDYYRYDR